jgi:hypothetical protein
MVLRLVKMVDTDCFSIIFKTCPSAANWTRHHHVARFPQQVKGNFVGFFTATRAIDQAKPV